MKTLRDRLYEAANGQKEKVDELLKSSVRGSMAIEGKRPRSTMKLLNQQINSTGGKALIETYLIDGERFRIVTGLKSPQGPYSVIHVDEVESFQVDSISEGLPP